MPGLHHAVISHEACMNTIEHQSGPQGLWKHSRYRWIGWKALTAW